MSDIRSGIAKGLWLCVPCAILVAGADSIAAQQIPDRPSLAVGSDVRVEYRVDAQERTVRGVLQSADAVALTLTTSEGSILTIRESALLGLEVSRGRSGGAGAWRGLAWGGAIGGVALGLLAGAGYSESTGECQVWCPNSRGDAFKFGALVGGAIGGSIGLTIGAVRGSERWERVR